MNRPKRSTAGVAKTVILLGFLATACAAKNDRTATVVTESASPTVVVATTIVPTTSESTPTTSTSSVAAPTTTLAAPISTEAAPNPARTVRVRAGEGWLVLARECGISARELFADNGWPSTHSVLPGDIVLCEAKAVDVNQSGDGSTPTTAYSTDSISPPTTALEAPSYRYVIRGGDSLLLISRRCSPATTPSAIAALNHWTVDVRLLLGQEIMLPCDPRIEASGE